MKFIVAIIKPAKLEEVDPLADVEVAGLTVSEVKGFGPKGKLNFMSTEYKLIFPKQKLWLPMIKLKKYHCNLFCPNTGKIGDEVIRFRFRKVIRIRTGETGEEALKIFLLSSL